jgi:hypothetical protein
MTDKKYWVFSVGRVSPMRIVPNLPEDIARNCRNAKGIFRVRPWSLSLWRNIATEISPLGFTSRFEVHAFLKQHNTYLNYTDADLCHDLELARSL